MKNDNSIFEEQLFVKVVLRSGLDVGCAIIKKNFLFTKTVWSNFFVSFYQSTLGVF